MTEILKMVALILILKVMFGRRRTLLLGEIKGITHCTTLVSKIAHRF